MSFRHFANARNDGVDVHVIMNLRIIILFIHNCLCVLDESTTPHPSFPADLF
jgi:hypothetical protein